MENSNELFHWHVDLIANYMEFDATLAKAQRIIGDLKNYGLEIAEITKTTIDNKRSGRFEWK